VSSALQPSHAVNGVDDACMGGGEGEGGAGGEVVQVPAKGGNEGRREGREGGGEGKEWRCGCIGSVGQRSAEK